MVSHHADSSRSRSPRQPKHSARARSRSRCRSGSSPDARQATHAPAEEPFALVRESLIRSDALRQTLPVRARVWLALMLHERAGQCWPSHARLAEMAGTHARSVRRALEELEDAGLLAREAREARVGPGRTTVYHLLTEEAAPADLDDASPEQAAGMGAPVAQIPRKEGAHFCPQGCALSSADARTRRATNRVNREITDDAASAHAFKGASPPASREVEAPCSGESVPGTEGPEDTDTGLAVQDPADEQAAWVKTQLASLDEAERAGLIEQALASLHPFVRQIAEGRPGGAGESKAVLLAVGDLLDAGPP